MKSEAVYGQGRFGNGLYGVVGYEDGIFDERVANGDLLVVVGVVLFAMRVRIVLFWRAFGMKFECLVFWRYGDV